MKKQTLCGVATSVLFLFFGRLPAFALSQQHLITVQVPFEFQVNEKLLPAGKYVIKRDSQNPQVLMIQCPERNVWVTVHTLQHSLWEQSAQTSLIFKEYGEKRFLSEIRVPARGEGYALIMSKTERRLAQAAKATNARATPGGAATNN